MSKGIHIIDLDNADTKTKLLVVHKILESIEEKLERVSMNELLECIHRITRGEIAGEC